MWERAYEELELESPPRRFLFTAPVLREKVDPIAIFIIGTGGYLSLPFL